jgi:hypothetical protein
MRSTNHKDSRDGRNYLYAHFTFSILAQISSPAFVLPLIGRLCFTLRINDSNFQWGQEELPYTIYNSMFWLVLRMCSVLNFCIYVIGMQLTAILNDPLINWIVSYRWPLHYLILKDEGLIWLNINCSDQEKQSKKKKIRTSLYRQHRQK